MLYHCTTHEFGMAWLWLYKFKRGPLADVWIHLVFHRFPINGDTTLRPKWVAGRNFKLLAGNDAHNSPGNPSASSAGKSRYGVGDVGGRTVHDWKKENLTVAVLLFHRAAAFHRAASLKFMIVKKSKQLTLIKWCPKTYRSGPFTYIVATSDYW